MKNIEINEKIIKENIVTYTCDICGYTSNHSDRCKVCSNCKKDLCNNHSHDEDSIGDYPEYFCPECYKRYRHYKDYVERKYEQILDNLYTKIMDINNTNYNETI